jgi:hypothetical protein
MGWGTWSLGDDRALDERHGAISLPLGKWPLLPMQSEEDIDKMTGRFVWVRAGLNDLPLVWGDARDVEWFDCLRLLYRRILH